MYYSQREKALRRRQFRLRLVQTAAVLLILLFAVMIILVVKGCNEKPIQKTSSFPSNPSQTTSLAASSQAPSVQNSASSTQNDASALDISAEINSWYLKLVNSNNPLPQNFVPEVADINPAYCRDANFRFDKRAVEYLNNMCKAAREDGINLLVISPYRSIKKQTELFAAKVSEYSNLPKEEAKTKAAAVVAVPGTSEHNLGLAVDFNSLETSFEKSNHFKWLSSNAHKYGFILRYPKSKQSVTGVIYEPWHYRYVGEQHATEIKSKNITLEEYIDYLKSKGDR